MAAYVTVAAQLLFDVTIMSSAFMPKAGGRVMSPVMHVHLRRVSLLPVLGIVQSSGRARDSVNP